MTRITGNADSENSNNISDGVGNSSFVGAFSELLVGNKIDDIAVQFQYNVLNTEYDLNPTETAVTGDGSNSASGSTAIASSVSSGTAQIQSRDSLRYIPGHTGFADFTTSFSGSGVGKAGCFDDEDGFYIKSDGGTISFGYLKSGVETSFTASTSFNINNPADIGIDFSKINIFRITFGYLGVANPTLWVKKNKWIPLHQIKTEGVLTGTHVNDPVFPMRIYAEDGMTVKSGSWNGGTIGGAIQKPGRAIRFPNIQIVNGVAAEQGEMTLSSANVGTVAIFHLKTTFQSLINKVKIKLLAYDFHVDIPGGTSTGTVFFQIVANPTLSGAASYSDINANSSTVEYDHTNGTGASVDATLGNPIISAHLEYSGTNKGGNVGNAQIDAEKIGAIGYPGDIFAIVAKDSGGNNVTVRVNLTWEELF